MKTLVFLLLALLATAAGLVMTTGATKYAFQVAFFIVAGISTLGLVSGSLDNG